MANSENARPATLALHADDVLNNVTDVAPPLHLSTTYRYSENPEDLVPWADATVCVGEPLIFTS
jgi:cystathionine beta-lyase